jgi:hypothetical protein
VGRYDFTDGQWSWSDTMFAMHGFAPGEVRPSSELMVAHLDPMDVQEARDAFKDALATGQPYSSYHHLIDAQSRRRTVLVAGEGELDDSDRLVSLTGYMVDLSDVVATDRRAEVDAAITGVTAHRAVIEQAKGMLMLAFGVGPDDAFEVLRAHSQDGNIRLHVLADQLVDGIVDGESDDSTRQRVRQVLADLTG